MKRTFKSFASVLVPVLLINVFVVSAAVFKDVSDSYAYSDAIAYVQKNNIVQGYSDGTFKAENNINRAEFIKIVMEAAFKDQLAVFEKNQSCFNDVKINDWYSEYVCLAKQEGIISGYNDGSFRPGNFINIAEASKILTNAFKYQTEKSTGAWYEPFVKKLDEKKALPTTINKLDQLLTRGEMAEMIYRLKENITNKPSKTFSQLQKNSKVVAKVDNWDYKPEENKDDYMSYKSIGPSASYAPNIAMDSAMSKSIGFSVGGAKDINNFRENIKNGYFPLSTDITHEGLFYDYYFDTGRKEECAKLFCPSYVQAISKDPFSKQDEYFLAVGLNSGIKEVDFKRKKLNLMLVLDISGSMGSPFDSYYYDQFGNQVNLPKGEESSKSKMKVAEESTSALMDHLGDDDRFGVVLFTDSASLAKPFSLVKDTDMQAIKNHILEVEATNGTNMDAGMQMATEQFKEFSNVDSNEYENRIIFLTDAMPNMGDDSKKGLEGMFKTNAENKIYTTFIGIGVDFNTQLVDQITKIRGANYYSVHSEEEFKNRMDEGFDYMVTPLVFNLALKLEAPSYEILKVYGSPEANEATGEIMKVNTLFPSKTEGGQTKGGIIILHLKKKADVGIPENPPVNQIILTASYEDRNGVTDSDSKQINFTNNTTSEDYFQNNGIRKGILLARYVNLIKSWIIDERLEDSKDIVIKPFSYCIQEEADGIKAGCIFPPLPPQLGQWERQSQKLSVSDKYKNMFKDFKIYFESEKAKIGDDELKKEVEILGKLVQ